MAGLRPVGGALLLLLLAPLVAAAPATGRLDVEGAAQLEGPVVLDAPAALLLWNATSAPTLTLDAPTLRVARMGTTHASYTSPLGQPVEVRESRIDERAEHQAARATLGAGEGDQVLVARAEGPTQLRAAQAQLRPVASARLFDGGGRYDGTCRDATYCADAYGVYEARAPAADAAADGAITLYLRGPTLRVTHQDGETTYRSGLSTRQDGVLTVVDDAWLVVTAPAGALALRGDAPALLYAAQPALQASALTAEGTGNLQVGTLTYRAHGERVDAIGALTLVPDPLPDERPDTVERTTYAPTFTTDVRGDVVQVNLRARPVFADSPPEQAGLLALLVGATALLAYYWPHVAFHGTSALLPLYTRLKKPEILDNDVRNAIYAIIRQNPGISARAVQRQSDLSWGTVVYHLRQLERHHLVVSRALGRTRNYYENHGKYKGMEIQLACLQSPRALLLARLILAHPGMTQEALAAESGYPQPTTSYYVRKLKQANLVLEQREGRYAHYVPGPELDRYLGLAENAREGAPAPPPTSA